MLRNPRARTVAKLALRVYGKKVQIDELPLRLEHPPRRWRWFARGK
ncbi:hypothetical protein [Oceanithermus sp.]